jgi:outer membrane protein assembly factor BamB
MLPAQLPAALPPPAWVAMAGLGTSPPAVAQGRVYVLGSFTPEADLADGVQAEEWLDHLDQAKQKLKSKGGGAATAGEAEKHGDAYVLGSDHLRCLDLRTGAQLWAARVSAASHPNGTCHNASTPLVHGGRVFVNTFDGRLVAVEAATGAPAWSVDLAGQGMASWSHKGGNWCSPLVVDGDKIAVSFIVEGTGTMAVAAFRAADGTRAWLSPRLAGGFRANKASLNAGIIDGVETVVVPNGSATWGLRAATGEVAFHFDLRRQFADLDAPRSDYGPACQYYYVNPLPLVWRNRVVDRNWIWYGNEGSRTHCLEVAGGTAKNVWQTTDLLSWTGEAALSGDTLIAFDQRYHAPDGPGRDWQEKWRVRVVPRRTGVGQLQARAMADGGLRWSSQALTPSAPTYYSKEPVEQSCRMYDGEAFYIVAGDAVVVRFLDQLRIGRMRADGIDLVATWPFRAGGRYRQPVVADGHLLLRSFDVQPPGRRGKADAPDAAAGNLHVFRLR